MPGPGLRVTIIGASDPGCDLALAAQVAGHRVTLVDEHPQTMAQMSFDAPWFYGAALPTALSNDSAMAQSVLEGAPKLVACFEAGVDVRAATIAWGAFQNGPNSRHVGAAKVGLVDATGNSLLEHDVLVLATGSRDFVPSFKGAEMPGVFGVKAGVAFLDLYQCYEGRETLILGTSARAVDFARRAAARGVRIAGMVEQGARFAAGPTAQAEISALGIPVLFGQAILAAEGGSVVTSARLCPTAGGPETTVACDSICLALGVLPNIELPAAMGCRLHFDEALGTWLPDTDAAGRTSLPAVFWLSKFGAVDAETTLAALTDPAVATGVPVPPLTDQGRYHRDWIAALHAQGGDAVTLCKCEDISRAAFLGLRPPAYLAAGLRKTRTPVVGGGTGPAIHQDQVKRLTRVGMGHCQGKRCRDEAALLLSRHFGCALQDIRPGSYRFPVRPINLEQIAAPDDTPDLRDKWSYWLHPSPSLT